MSLRTSGLALGLALVAGLTCPPRSSTIAAAGLARARPRAVAPPAPKARCPGDMQWVDGWYCPKVEHHCLRYLDPPGRYQYFRCAEYESPARCLSLTRRHLSFCIDRDEYTSAGESLPANFQSFTDAEATCRSLGKRVCLESEWNFACEGEEMRPYPYGFTRDPRACNADLVDLFDGRGRLKDLRAPNDASPGCVSPFGVRNLAGNLEEMVARDGTRPVLPAMKGAYWQPSRNHCRAAQTAHDRYYKGIETGFRCCRDRSTL